MGYQQKYRPVVMQYIPIQKTIAQLLEKPGFFAALERNKSFTGEIYSSFREGSLFNEKVYPKETVFINLYCDEAEMANPLGSKAGKHKLMNFYSSFLDLPAHFQASISNIPLLASLKSEDFKSSSANNILKFIIDELKELWENGITFTVDGKQHNVKISLSQICGDNLGLHALLGFSEGFTANYPCRRCKMHRTECQISIYADIRKLRNQENYDHDCEVNKLSLTGINFESVANQLPYFHVTDNFVFDIMHDILEGVGPDLLVHLINHCISLKYFGLDKLNYRIESFNYGHHFKTSKPSQIKLLYLKTDNKIGQSASQMLCLLICFPLLVIDCIPSNDDTWNLFLLFLEILNILLATKLTDGGLVYLNSLISEFCMRYQKNFSRTLKPKHHHLLHYVEAMQKIGPLRPFWSMTFESKHKFFKTTAHSICNFKNISKSLAYRHQLARSFNLLSIQEFSPSSVIHDGCEYRVGCFVLLEYCTKYPKFGKVSSIILENEDCNLCVVEVIGNFNEKLNSYTLGIEGSARIIDINNIQFYLPLYALESFELLRKTEYIVLPIKFV